MRPADVDRRVQQGMAGLRLLVEIITDLVIGDDGTGTGNAQDGNPIGFEVCAGPVGFKCVPLDQSASGVVVKIGGEGASSIMFGFRDRQYELSLQKGETGIWNYFGVSILLDKNGIANINGNAYSGLKTEDLLSDLKGFISAVIADLASAAAAPASAYSPTVNTTPLFAKAVTGNGVAYKSTKVKMG